VVAARSGKLEFLPMKIGVVVFPGSNCDHDAWYAFSHNLGQQAEFLWHDTPSVGHVDAVVLPGGFSYGDYLRCSAAHRDVNECGSGAASDGGSTQW
jgi:phosphoribosylformylglycinamidine (FGAM) synthase-like amidotransferase family enzyme